MKKTDSNLRVVSDKLEHAVLEGFFGIWPEGELKWHGEGTQREATRPKLDRGKIIAARCQRCGNQFEFTERKPHPIYCLRCVRK